MIEFAMVAALAALYVLGKSQGETIARVINEVLAGQNVELDGRGKFLLTWGWPIATIMSYFDTEEDDNGRE